MRTRTSSIRSPTCVGSSKRDKTKARLRAGEIRPEDFLQVEPQTTALVRYYRDTAARNRRDMLRLNTAVGRRVLL